MKKGIYVNISIITALCLMLSLYKESSYGAISGFIMIVCIIAAYRLSYIFIPREDRITQKRKVTVIVFITLNYSAILGLAITRYYNLLIADYVTGGLLALYLILIMFYLESIFDKNQKADKR